MAHLPRHRSKHSDALTFSAKPTLQYSTGFHSAPLRPTFTSVAFSPPAAYNLACLAACFGCEFDMVFVLSSYPLKIKNTYQTLASHCCSPSPFRLHWVAPQQAHADNSSRASLHCLRWRHAICKPPKKSAVLSFFFSRRRYNL